MGGAVSRTRGIFGGVMPDEPLESRKKNDSLSRYREVKKLKNLSELDSNERNQLQIVITGRPNQPLSVQEKVLPDTEYPVPDTERSSIGSNDTETMTPNFGFPDTDSIYSQPTQKFEQYVRPATEQTAHGIYSQTTQNIDENTQGFHNRADNDDNSMGEFWNQCEISQPNIPSIVSPTSSRSIASPEISAQKNIETIDNCHGDLNRNFLKLTFPRKAQSFSSTPTFSFPRTTSNEPQQHVPIFDIGDINDFSQVPSPNFGPCQLSMLLKSQSSSVPFLDDSFNDHRKIIEQVSQDNDKLEVVVQEAEQVFINNELKRKRKTDRRAKTSTEDKENGPSIINSQQEDRHRIKKFVFNVHAKNPLHSDDTLTPVSQARNLNLNDSAEKSGDSFSPDVTSPEYKKRRLRFPVSSNFVIKNYDTTPLHSHERNKKVYIINLSQEDDPEICKSFNDEENGKSTAEETSQVLRNTQQEKPSTKPVSEVKRSTITSDNAREVETTTESSLDGDDRKQNTSHKLIADEKQAAIVVNDSTEKRRNAFSPNVASPEYKIRHPRSPVSSNSVIKNYDTTPLHSRERNKKVYIVNLSQEDDPEICQSFNDEESGKSTAEETSQVLRNSQQEKPSTKPVSEVKRSTITSDNAWNVETTTESSRDVNGDDRKQNTSYKLIADEKQAAIVVNDSTEKRGNAFSPNVASPEYKIRRPTSPVSSNSVIKNYDTTPFHSRERNKNVYIINLSQEDDTEICKSLNDKENGKSTAEETSQVLRNSQQEKPSTKPVSEVKRSTITSDNAWNFETTTESSLDVNGDDRKQNTSHKLIADEKQAAIVVNDSTEKRGNAFSPNVASPEYKIRRPRSPVSSNSVIKNYDTTPLHSRERNERPYIVNLSQEDDTEICQSFKDEENGKSTAEETSQVLRNTQQEKPSTKPVSEVKRSTITSDNARKVETTPESSRDVNGDDRKQNTSHKLIADEKQAAIVVNDSTEKRGNGFTPKRASPKIKNRRRIFQSWSTFHLNDCGSTPFRPRGSMKTVDIIDLTEEDEVENENNTAVSTSMIKREEKPPLTKPPSEVKLSTIASNTDAEDSKTTAGGSSLDVNGNDRKQNASQKLIADETRSSIVVNPLAGKRKAPFSPSTPSLKNKKRRLNNSPVSPIFEIRACKTPFHPYGTKKRLFIVDLTQVEDEKNERNTAEASSIVLKNSPKEKTPSEVKLTAIARNDVETTSESSLTIDDDDRKKNVVNGLSKSAVESPDVGGENWKQKAAHESMTDKNRSAIVINDADSKTSAKSPIVSATDGDESSQTSTSTYFTQSSSIATILLLSDRCSEYNQCLQDENLPDRSIAENTIGVTTTFIANFDVSFDVINQQVDDILTFLEADIAAN